MAAPAVADAPAQAPPQTKTMWNIWDLAAEPAALDRTAGGWRDLAKRARRSAQTVDTPSARIEGSKWRGEAATAFGSHRRNLTADVRDAATHADKAGKALEDVAGSLRTAQRLLTDDLHALGKNVPYSIAGKNVTFTYKTQEQSDAITAAVTEAKAVRSDLDAELVRLAAPIQSATAALESITVYWTAGGGQFDGWTDESKLPAEVPGTRVIWDFKNNRMIINTGTGNDTVEVRIDPATGNRYVMVNGVRYDVPAGIDITVRGGEGNDTITVPHGFNVNLTALGGAGKDRITTGSGNDTVLAGDEDDTVDTGYGDDYASGGRGNDRISTGDGSDRVFAGDGDDKVYSGRGDDTVNAGDGNDYVQDLDGNDQISAGDGSDTVYAGSGRDRVLGEAGDDYLESGKGHDTVAGGGGNDIVSGGRDNDDLRGGSGDDRLYGGDGTDRVDGETGRGDQAFVQRDDTATAEKTVTVELHNLPDIDVRGSDEFRERVMQDLELLRGSPAGRQMLDQFQNALDDGNTIVIKELPANLTDRDGDADSSDRYVFFGPEEYTIRLRPESTYPQPITTLYHEMAHVYDSYNDTAAEGRHEGKPEDWTCDDGEAVRSPNEERAAVGLPIDHDGDPRTPPRIDPRHPKQYTENGLLDEFGRPERPTYGQDSKPTC